MAKTLGIIFGSILAALPLMFLDTKYGNGFLLKFFREQSIGIVATVLALNIATLTFLLGHLASIESKIDKDQFIKTRHELRDNARFMLFLFGLIFVVVSCMSSKQVWSFNSITFNPLVLLALVAFILVFVCLYEILGAIFESFKFLTKSK